MANLNTIEKQHKEIFNNLNFEEKQEYFKNLSEEKFKHINFISKEGNVVYKNKKFGSLDNIQVLINKDKDVNKMASNCGLAITYDYLALLDKYNEEFKVAISFYHDSILKNATIIEHNYYFLDSFLGVFVEEPSVLLYYVLQDVAKSTEKRTIKAKTDIDSYFVNMVELTEGIEEFSQLEDLIEKGYSKYISVLKKIENLEEPEGVNNNG